MPSRPPPLKAKLPKPKSNWNRKRSTTERGYGWQHQQMRERVLREEPLCRICKAMEPRRYSQAVIADHVVPKVEGGSDDRENYQGLCKRCSDAKTQAEAVRARSRHRRC